jgi:hypothetical protein
MKRTRECSTSILRQHGWRIEMHAVGGSGDDRQTVISSALPLRIRASANNSDHKPHYRPLIQPATLSTCNDVNVVGFAYQRGVRWILGQFTGHPPYAHIFSAASPSCTEVGESYR